MDSSRVRQKEKEKKKFQRSNIENKMEYGGDYKEGYCGERKFSLKKKNINILVIYTTNGLYKKSAIQKMGKQSTN